MFDRSGEIQLSSLGLLLIFTACVMTMFAQPGIETNRGTPTVSEYHPFTP